MLLFYVHIVSHAHKHTHTHTDTQSWGGFGTEYPGYQISHLLQTIYYISVLGVHSLKGLNFSVFCVLNATGYVKTLNVHEQILTYF